MFSGSYSKPSSRKERAKRSAAKIPVATPTVAAGLLNSCLRFAVTDSPAVHQFGQASNAGLWHLTCQLGLQHFPPQKGYGGAWVILDFAQNWSPIKHPHVELWKKGVFHIDQDYSALLISFAKRVRQSQPKVALIGLWAMVSHPQKGQIGSRDVKAVWWKIGLAY